jgi:uncharacterized membrane protein YhhN
MMTPSATMATGFGTPTLLLLLASVVAGLGYPFVSEGFLPLLHVVAKGAGVGLLAVAAFALPRRDRAWLGLIMTAGALGDILLELPGLFFVGAGAFAIGHVIAMTFYRRHPASTSGTVDRIAAAVLIGWGLVMPGLVSPAGTPVGLLMLYSVLLCGMAAALLLSRFSRLAVVGALLFVASDTLLIMRLGGSLVGGEWLHGLLVWFSYYLGQLAIFVGVAVGLPPRVPQ